MRPPPGVTSYARWYDRSPNEAEVAERHAHIRDAMQVAEKCRPHGRRVPPALSAMTMSAWARATYRQARRAEWQEAIAAVNAIPWVGVEPSPRRRHENVLIALPTLAYIREWGAQWKAARAAASVRRGKPGVKRCPHCGGKL